MKKFLFLLGLMVVGGAGSALANCNATANAPALTAGSQACSMDLSGNLRTIGTQGAGGTNGSVTAAGTGGTVAQAVQGIAGGVAQPISGTVSALIGGSPSTPTHVSGTTSATAGVSSTLVAANGVTKGIIIQNTCATAEWFSPSLAVGTALTAVNSETLAPGASFVTPDWFSISGAWTIASATAAACTYVADYK